MGNISYSQARLEAEAEEQRLKEEEEKRERLERFREKKRLEKKVNPFSSFCILRTKSLLHLWDWEIYSSVLIMHVITHETVTCIRCSLEDAESYFWVCYAMNTSI